MFTIPGSWLFAFRVLYGIDLLSGSLLMEVSIRFISCSFFTKKAAHLSMADELSLEGLHRNEESAFLDGTISNYYSCHNHQGTFFTGITLSGRG